MKRRTLTLRATFLTLFAGCLMLATGCDHYSEYVSVYERLPEEDNLSCMEVCESIVASDRGETVTDCEDVTTTDDRPGVVCLFEYYDPPRLTG